MNRALVALASRNPGKLREIRSILSTEGVGVDVIRADPRWEPPIEDAPDYEGNALIKARSLADFARVPAIADDSGIEVDALDGAPGVRSARFAGDGATDTENLAKLIPLIERVPPERRTARYRCVAAVVLPDGDEEIASGSVEGSLLTVPRGTGGFGYDPIFVPAGSDRTMAELSSEEKDAISHRGKAFRALALAIARMIG